MNGVIVMVFEFVRKEKENYLLKSKFGTELLLTKRELNALLYRHRVKILNLNKNIFGYVG